MVNYFPLIMIVRPQTVHWFSPNSPNRHAAPEGFSWTKPDYCPNAYSFILNLYSNVQRIHNLDLFSTCYHTDIVTEWNIYRLDLHLYFSSLKDTCLQFCEGCVCWNRDVWLGMILEVFLALCIVHILSTKFSSHVCLIASWHARLINWDYSINQVGLELKYVIEISSISYLFLLRTGKWQMCVPFTEFYNNPTHRIARGPNWTVSIVKNYLSSVIRRLRPCYLICCRTKVYMNRSHSVLNSRNDNLQLIIRDMF